MGVFIIKLKVKIIFALFYVGVGEWTNIIAKSIKFLSFELGSVLCLKEALRFWRKIYLEDIHLKYHYDVMKQ